MSQSVLLELREGIATITLNRPQVLNVLDVEMMQALRAAVEAVKADTSAHVLIICGAGENFMAGGDIKLFQAMLGVDPQARLQAMQAMIEQWINPTVLALQELHQPVIAKVRGACAGFGLSFVLGCDFAFAADTAVFRTAYSQIGLSPDGGASHFLSRQVGARRALELLMLSERLSAQEALDAGLVNRVVAAASLDREVEAFAARLAAGPRHAYAEIKRLVHGAAQADLSAQLADECAAFARCSATQDFAEGVQAFLDKRAPRFRGK